MDTRALILITQGLPEPHLLVSRDGTIQEANRAAHAILGYGSSLVGRDLGNISPESPDKLKAFLRRCSGTRSVTVAVLRLLKNDGNRIVAFRCEGGVVAPARDNEPTLLVIRCREQTSAISRFASLNSERALLNATLRAGASQRRKQPDGPSKDARARSRTPA
jgi:PAS domain S-box-containing protein